MKSKVTSVKRSTYYSQMQQDAPRHDVHAVRHTNTYANTTSADKVCIDENDIKSFYDRKRITSNLIALLDIVLKGVEILYELNPDGDFALKGSISDYIKPKKKK